MIEDNDGPEELDLSGKDISEIDLSSDVIRVEMERLGFPYDNPPSWYSIAIGGINLRGAILKGSDFRGARLWRGDYRKANLSGAQLQKSDLGDSTLAEANLRGANLDGAILSRIDVQGADLTGAKLVNADVAGVDLSVAKSLEGVGEEREQHYYRAKEAYLALKNNFLSLGRYDDASWAYLKERQMARMANHPVRARRFYGEIELPVATCFLSTSVWFFYARHSVKWMLDWMAELSCGYGERPLRTIFWALVVIVTFPFFYQWSGGLSTATGYSPRWIDYLQYSLAAFSTMNLPDIIPANDFAKLLTSMEALFGISVLALLMFALGNRIGRF